jgi:hypothetical protein
MESGVRPRCGWWCSRTSALHLSAKSARAGLRELDWLEAAAEKGRELWKIATNGRGCWIHAETTQRRSRIESLAADLNELSKKAHGGLVIYPDFEAVLGASTPPASSRKVNLFPPLREHWCAIDGT